MVDNYIGKSDLAARTAKVNRETRPAIKKLSSESKGVITRKGGGK